MQRIGSVLRRNIAQKDPHSRPFALLGQAPSLRTLHPMTPSQVLRWYIAQGVDDCVAEHTLDRTRAAPVRFLAPVESPLPVADSSAHLALQAASLADLQALMQSYDGCALKRSCQSTVFGDGNPAARLMIVGEAPGADEDRLGLPFVGASGRLLDSMLAGIGLDRGQVYISNVVPWRPPGNRKPEPAEVELCLPFIRRQIELVDPALLLLLGGAASASLLARSDSISRLRGQWLEYTSHGLARPIPALPTFHPAFLLRTPLQKREAWRDLLAVRQRLDQLG